jgi:hypothetical protein
VGPKTSFGGRRGGFSRSAYHVDIFGTVAREPTAPAVNVIRMAAIHWNTLLRVCIYVPPVSLGTSIIAYLGDLL